MTLLHDNELNHYYTKFDTVLLVGLPDAADVSAVAEKCEVFGGVSSVRRPEVRVARVALASCSAAARLLSSPPIRAQTQKKKQHRQKK